MVEIFFFEMFIQNWTIVSHEREPKLAKLGRDIKNATYRHFET